MPATEFTTGDESREPAAVIGAIPARYGSTRLPGKPLREIAGEPLIAHVYRRAIATPELSRVVVLTDDDRIAKAVAGFGGNCEMTPSDCPSGSDRIAHAARGWDIAAVVNIQGDEPLIDPRAISAVARHLREHPEDPMVTLAAPAGPEDKANPDIVKVVVDRAGMALYFSRAEIPYPRSSEGAPALRHIGIYGYQKEALMRLTSLAPSPLEKSESLEQLRALENGIEIRVLLVEKAWQGVDTIDDLKEVESILGAS